MEPLASAGGSIAKKALEAVPCAGHDGSCELVAQNMFSMRKATLEGKRRSELGALTPKGSGKELTSRMVLGSAGLQNKYANAVSQWIRLNLDPEAMLSQEDLCAAIDG